MLDKTQYLEGWLNAADGYSSLSVSNPTPNNCSYKSGSKGTIYIASS